jgi:hypothetical protein
MQDEVEFLAKASKNLSHMARASTIYMELNRSVAGCGASSSIRCSYALSKSIQIKTLQGVDLASYIDSG